MIKQLHICKSIMGWSGGKDFSPYKGEVSNSTPPPTPCPLELWNKLNAPWREWNFNQWALYLDGMMRAPKRWWVMAEPKQKVESGGDASWSSVRSSSKILLKNMFDWKKLPPLFNPLRSREFGPLKKRGFTQTRQKMKILDFLTKPKWERFDQS